MQQKYGFHSCENILTDTKVHWTIRNIMQDERSDIFRTSEQKTTRVENGSISVLPEPSLILDCSLLLYSWALFVLMFVQCHASWISCDCKAWPLWAPITPLCLWCAISSQHCLWLNPCWHAPQKSRSSQAQSRYIWPLCNSNATD